MKSNKQKQAEYTPSRTELQLLEVLLDPASRLKPVTELCKEAGINRATYYTIFGRPEFKKLYREQSLSIIQRALAPICHAVIREAVRGSAQHAKMGLEMADVYTEKLEVTTETYAERVQRLRAAGQK